MGQHTDPEKGERIKPRLIVNEDGKPYYHIPIYLPDIWNAVHRWFVKEVGDID